MGVREGVSTFRDLLAPQVQGPLRSHGDITGTEKPALLTDTESLVVRATPTHEQAK